MKTIEVIALILIGAVWACGNIAASGNAHLHALTGLYLHGIPLALIAAFHLGCWWRGRQ